MITYKLITTKAQLICKHLDYEFDVLMSVVPGVLNDSQGYFTLFSSKHKYFIKQTAICFYSIEAINRHFSTSNSFYDNETFETKKWPPTTLNSNTAHPKGIDPTRIILLHIRLLWNSNTLGIIFGGLGHFGVGFESVSRPNVDGNLRKPW